MLSVLLLRGQGPPVLEDAWRSPAVDRARGADARPTIVSPRRRWPSRHSGAVRGARRTRLSVPRRSRDVGGRRRGPDRRHVRTRAPHIDDTAGRRGFLPWLLRIARNASIDAHAPARTGRPRAGPGRLGDGALSDTGAGGDQFRGAARDPRRVARLPDAQRDALALRSLPASRVARSRSSSARAKPPARSSSRALAALREARAMTHDIDPVRFEALVGTPSRRRPDPRARHRRAGSGRDPAERNGGPPATEGASVARWRWRSDCWSCRDGDGRRGRTNIIRWSGAPCRTSSAPRRRSTPRSPRRCGPPRSTRLHFPELQVPEDGSVYGSYSGQSMVEYNAICGWYRDWTVAFAAGDADGSRRHRRCSSGS